MNPIIQATGLRERYHMGEATGECWISITGLRRWMLCARRYP